MWPTGGKGEARDGHKMSDMRERVNCLEHWYKRITNKSTQRVQTSANAKI